MPIMKMDMCNCLKMPTSRIRKILASIFVFLTLCVGAWTETYTNPTDDTTWADGDTIIFTSSADIQLTSDHILNVLTINAGTNLVTIDLNGKSLSVSDTLNLGTGNENHPGNLKVINTDTANPSSVSVHTFDECDDANNFLELSNVSFIVTTKLYCNGKGITTITGDSSSSFTTPSDYSGYNGSTSQVISFPETLQPISQTGNYTFSVSGTGGPGKTVTITVSNNTDNFSDLKYKATVYETGETYTINGDNITENTASIQSINFSTPSSEQTFDIVFPATIQNTHGIQLEVYAADGTTKLGTVYYTQQSNQTKWTGITSDDWNSPTNWTYGVPANGMDVIIQEVNTNNPVISSTSQAITSLTIDSGAELSISTDGQIVATTIINNGKITFSGGTLTATTKENGNGSVIVYDGTTSLIWGNSYENLVINSGEITLTGISIGNDFTNNSTVIIQGTTDVTGIATNNGTLTIKTDSFTPDSVTNENGSSVIYDGVSSPVWGYSYQNLTITSSTSISFSNIIIIADSLENNGTITFGNDATVTGTAINNGIITFGLHSFSAATKQNGTSSTIIYDGATNPVWGNSYQNLTVAAGTSIAFASATTVLGKATNNGTITIGSNSFTVGSIENGDSSTIIYDGATSLGWGEHYKYLEVKSGGLILSADSKINASSITINGSVTNSSKALTLNSPNIYVNNTIETGNLTIEKGNVAIAGGTTLYVNGLLTLGSEEYETNVHSSSGTQWTLHCTGENNHTITNAKIKDSNNTSEHNSTSYNLIATASFDDGNNTNWIFDGIEYVWQGGSTNWNTASNWEPASVPGKGSIVTIPAEKDSYPILSAALNLKYNDTYEGSITIEYGAKFDLSDKVLTIGTLTNNGLVRLKGITNQIVGTVSNGTANSSVEYYDNNTTLSSVPWGTEYKNLLINKPAILGNTSITIENNLTISDAATISGAVSIGGITSIKAGTGKLVSLDNASNVFNGDVIIGDSSVSPQVKAGIVTLNGKGPSSSAIYLEDNILADSLTLNSSVQGNNLTFDTPLILNAPAITTIGDQKYKEAVTLGADTTLKSTSGNISFDSTINGAKQITLNVPETKTITVTGTIGNITPCSVTIAQAYTATFDDTITATSFSITNASSTIFNDEVNITTFTDAAPHTGNITFANGGTITNAVTLNTVGTVSINGPMNIGSTSPWANLTHTAGDTNITGTLNAGEINLGNSTTNNLTKITGGTITATSISTAGLTIAGTDITEISTTGTQTYNGAVNGTSLKIMQSNGTTFNNTVVLTSLEDTINSGNITFNGNTTIKSDTTFNTTGTVSFNNSKIFNFAEGDTKKSLTHSAGITNISGDLNASEVSLNNLAINGNITTSPNGISITGATKINGNSELQAPQNKIIDFTGVVEGTQNTEGNNQYSLTTKLADVTFGSTVSKLTSLTTDGLATFNNDVTVGTASIKSAIINCDNIETSGNQIYKADVTINNTTSLVSLTSGNSSTITFEDKIKSSTGNQGLALTAATTYFGNAANDAVTELVSLTVNGNSVINTDTISTNGNQTYNGTTQFNSAATVTSGGSQKYSGMITLNGNLTLKAETTSVTFGADISGNRKTLTVNSPELISSIATGATPANITLDELILSRDTKFKSTNGTGVTLNVTLISGTGKTLTISSSVSELALSGNTEIRPILTTENGSHLKVSSSNTTFMDDINLANGTLSANGGTIILTGTNKTPSGTSVTLNGDNTFNNLILQNSVTINGSNTITNLTAGNETTGLGGKTLTFRDGTTQTISGVLSLCGSENSENNRLLLRSSKTGTAWEIKCTGANKHAIQYIDVQDGYNISETSSLSYNLFALNSLDSGNNTNWNFPAMEYSWTGNESTDWNNMKNWSPASIPGKGAVVSIPAGKTKYPILEVKLDLNDTYGTGTNSTSYNGTITVDSGATFDLAGQSLTVGTITNNGRVHLTGSSGQAITGNMENETGSTVEYYGSGTTPTNFAWDGDASTNGKQYAHLILNQDTSSSDVLTISENLTINNHATLTGNISIDNNLIISEAATLSGVISVSGTTTISAGADKVVSLDNASNSFTGNVIAGNSTATTPVNAGAVTLRAGTLITLENNAYADSLTINSSIQLQNVTTIENQTYNGNVAANGVSNLISTGTSSSISFNSPVSGNNSLSLQAADININCTTVTTTGSQTYDGTVTLGDNTGHTELTSGASISFASTIDGSKDLKLTSNSGTTFNEQVGKNTNLSSIEVNGPATINCDSITTTGSQKYKGAITLEENTELTSTNNDITFESTINGAHTIKLSVPNNEARKISVAGKIGDNDRPEITIVQAGTVTFGETVKATSFGITKANSTTFNKSVEIGTFEDDSTHTGTITFADGGNISTDTEFKTTGIVSFGDNTSDTMNFGNSSQFADLIHTAGTTSITGTLNASAVTLKNISINGTLNSDITQLSDTTLNGTINAASISTDTFTTTGDNSSIVSTTGNQTYNGAVTLNADVEMTSTEADISFVSTIDGTHSIVLSIPDNEENTINIAGEVGKDERPAITIAQAGTVSFDETVKASSFEITKANSTTFDKAVEINTFTDTANSGAITFANGGTISTDTDFETNGIVYFGDAASDTMNFGIEPDSVCITHTTGNTEIVGNINARQAEFDDLIINGKITTSSEGIVINGITTINGNSELLAPETKLIHFDKSVTGTQSEGNNQYSLTTKIADATFESRISKLTFLTTEGTATFKGNITEVGTLTTNAAKIDCQKINTTGLQAYGDAVTLDIDTELTSLNDNIIFNSTINGEYSIKLSVPNSVDKTISVTGMIGENARPAIIIVQAGTVNFDETVNATSFEITQADSTTFAKPVNIGTFTDSTTHTGNISFQNGGTISTDTVFDTSGTITFGDKSSDIMNFGTETDFANITHDAGDTIITGTLKASAITLGTTRGGPMTITNYGLFETTNNSALTYSSSFTQNGPGTTMLGGNFTSFTGNGTATFATSVYLYGSETAEFGTNTPNITIGTNQNNSASNLIFARTGDLTVNADSVTADNIVFYDGTVNVNGDIISRKDIVILGNEYSTLDPTTGIEDEYSYSAARPDNWKTANYTFETNMPDGSALPDTTSFGTTLSIASGKSKIIHVGKNFYANGTSLTGDNKWYIDILSNADSSICFAEAYNSEITNCIVRCYTDSKPIGTSNPDNAQIPTENCQLSKCENFDNSEFEIAEVYTTRDNVVYVKFNRDVRNQNGELTGAVAQFKYFHKSDNDTSYISVAINEDGSTILGSSEEKDTIYLVAATDKTWNTDATGKNPGETKSTDRYGDHKNAKPYIDIPRALGTSTTSTQNAVITDRFGKRLKNYSTRTPTQGHAYGTDTTSGSETYVLDHTGPVLVQVRTGQETHDTSLTAQKAYDSHNFIEFIYSESVNFGNTSDANDTDKLNTADWIPAYEAGTSATPNTPQNIKVSSSLGYLSENGSLTFAGLNQTIEKGKIKTASTGTSTQDVNAFYRQSTHSIKYSLAGYADNVETNGTINGDYINWAGYIDSETSLPNGTVTFNSTPENLVTDCATDSDGTTPLYNHQIMNKPDLEVNNNEEAGTNYGVWDLQPPVFVKAHKKGEDNDQDYYEAIGNGDGSTLNRIEIHISDNPSSLTNEISKNGIWLTRYGWASSIEPSTALSPAADKLIGGARPYGTSDTTSGGLRYCTILNQENAFKYSDKITLSPNKEFVSITSGASASYFVSSTDNRNEIPTEKDNTYINLELSDTNLPYETSFTISYNDSNSYITDLAGNRLRNPDAGIMNTVDRTPPDFKITFAPIGSNKLLLIFVKKLTNNIQYYQKNSEGIYEEKHITDFEQTIPYCFEIGKITDNSFDSKETDLQIDTSEPATKIDSCSNDYYTAIELTLTRPVTLEDVKNCYIRLKEVDNDHIRSKDILTNLEGSYVSFIQDDIGNYMQMYQAHALSDFASGIIDPLYAYNDDLEYNEENISENLYSSGSWAIHDWNEEQKNYGTLIAQKPVTVIANIDENNLTSDTAGLPEFSLRMYFSTPSPDADSQSEKFNSDIPENKLRLWMPTIDTAYNNGLFPAYSEKTNSNYSFTDGLQSESNLNQFSFEINTEKCQSFTSGKQISFLFGLFDSTGTVQENICLSPILTFSNETATYNIENKVPLYLIRLKDPSQITSMDLWSFKVKDIKSQRGGVTILNNVINASHGEKTVIKVDVPTEGKLNVIVMTLDGNIITYLHRGNAKAGENYFTWDGKNRNGNLVARGMYFIRVTGADFDETRKVMVVK